MKISLTSIFVNSPVEAHKFYTQVLGFQSRMFIPEMNLAIVASPEEPAGTGLMLEPNDNPIASSYQKGLYEQKLPAIVFGVDDIHAETARLKKQGVIFTKEPTRTDWGFEAVFEDTCGNFIQLAEMAKS